MVLWDWEVKEKVKQEVQRKKIDFEKIRFKKTASTRADHEQKQEKSKR